MHRIDTKTAQKDKFGAGKNGFTRGNPQTGTPATDLDDDYFDMLQEELCSVVEASGASLEKGRHDQLLTALRALLLSRKNPFGDIKSDGTVQTALENLQLGEAAKRDVGSGAGQVPDMSNFQSGGGWFKLPSGYVIQAFEASFDSNGLYINFPIPFPSSVIAIVPGVLMSTTASPSLQFPSIQRDVNDLTRFFAKYNMGGMNSSYFIAIGK
ncbi:hypothetical protein [Escherichia coli]|uniref:gp53-like domain-containing protein n=1 Tax=Escherichia coli TaxID=562 RepID=UPI0021D49D8E|nr:hypothetical protein [Escherichia coli]MCU6968146.1 hypothetical protein [Escherichia coli]